MGVRSRNPVQEGLRKATPDTDIGHSPCSLISIRELAKRQVTAPLAPLALPHGEGTLCEKPTPDKRQELTAMGKRFSLCPDEVMDPGETA